MLDKTMIDRLNYQLNLESYSVQLFLQMSLWCADKGFVGTAAFLQKCAEEERGHLQRIIEYVSGTGAMPILGTTNAPPHEFSSITDLFQQIYEYEQLVSEKFKNLSHFALTTQDYATFNLAQWFVADQHLEEQIWRTLLDQLELFGDDMAAVMLIDCDLGRRAKLA